MKLLDAIDNLNVHKKGNRRSPHKPLLLLYALAREAQCSNAKLEFSQIEKPINNLLSEFWNFSSQTKAHYPFWRLREDGGIWEVYPHWKIEKTERQDAKIGSLRKHKATGYFSQEVVQEIKNDRSVVWKAVQKLLNDYFPASLHSSILERVGLFYEAADLENSHENKPEHDPEFRENVLRAYGYSCAVCGFSLQTKALPVGLEAAHIKWHQYGGPDTEDNGLALCATHQKLLDSGVWTLSDDRRIILFSGCEGMFIQKQPKIRSPRNKRDFPRLDYIRWHRREVFRERASKRARTSA